jgi:hypothetical protein
MATNLTALVLNHMSLQLNSSAPDPIGFGQVSGFYGPGAWAAWFLALVGSWLGLVKKPHHVDHNTLLYLAGLNWVAVDLLRHMIRLNSLKQANNPAWMKEAASVGAAFIVAWWGLFHALLQLFFCVGPFYDVDYVNMMRRFALMAGSALPAASLFASLWFITEIEVSAKIPALFWNGMDIKLEQRKDRTSVGTEGQELNTGHAIALVSPALAGFGALIVYMALIIHAIWYNAVPEKTRHTITTAVLNFWRLSWRYLIPALVLSYIALVIVTAVRHLSALWYFLPLYPLLILFNLIFLLPSLILHSFCLSTAYIFSAYFRWRSSPSQSCYFMPCAPQPISDMDQAFTLFLGLFSLFFIEYGVPYIRKIRKERREMLLFEEEVRGRIQMSSRTGGTSSGSPPDSSLDPTGVQHQNAEATGIDVRPQSRINSGLAAEEGVAGPDWRLRRANSAPNPS